MFFNYDLFLNLEGNPPVNHLRCEKLTFNNPTKDFRRKLIKAGGVRLPDTLAARRIQRANGTITQINSSTLANHITAVEAALLPSSKGRNSPAALSSGIGGSRGG